MQYEPYFGDIIIKLAHYRNLFTCTKDLILINPLMISAEIEIKLKE